MKKARVVDPIIKDITNQIVSLREKIKELKKQLQTYKMPKSETQVSFIINFD